MTSTPTQEVQDQFLKAIRVGQETVLDGIRTFVETIQSVSPKVPQVHLPLADKLPKPTEVVATAYDFAEKLLASQRQFAQEVLQVTASLADGTKQADSTEQAAGAPKKAGNAKAK
jgi:hypothetical protein